VQRGASADLDMTEPVALRRSLGLPLVTLYGIGVTVGAGIYVLVGKVAGTAGLYAPVAFLISAVLAALTALSYGELGARYPYAAGAAIFVQRAFASPSFSTLIGLLVLTTAVVSSAAIVIGFTAYLEVVVALPEWLALTLLMMALAAIAAWGITLSITLAACFTVMEVCGLLLVVGYGADALPTLAERLPELLPPFSAGAWGAILSAALLAFFAYIGFEDIVNVAEEAIDPARLVPRAIVLTIGITTALYLAVALVVVLKLPPDVLARAGAPLLLVFADPSGPPARAVGLIAVFAVLNGALIQLIMASRLLYGLSRQGWLPAVVGRLHPRTQTPIVATVLVAAAVLGLALLLPIIRLAEVTSYLTLAVFAAVNVSLVVIKLRHGEPEKGQMRVPLAVPALGALACGAMAILNLLRAAV